MDFAVNVVEVSAVQRRLEFTVPQAHVSAELDKAYKNLSREVRLKGFRQGKVPRKMLEARFRSHVEGEVGTRIISEAFDKALVDHDIQPVAQPEVDPGPLKKDLDYSFSVNIEVKPVIELTTWEGVAVEWEKVEVSDDDLDAEIEQRRDAASTIEPVEDGRGIEESDLPEVNYTLTAEGMEPLVREGYLLSLSSDPYHGFLTELVMGLKKGDSNEGAATIPENYVEEGWRGVEAQVAVTVTELKALVKPELDDEFAADLGFDDLESMRGSIRFEKQQAAEKQARDEASVRLLRSLIELNTFDVPEGLVTNQARDQLRLQFFQMQRMGLQVPATELEGLPDSMREQLLSDAREAVQRSLILEAVARTAELEVSDEQLEQRYDELAQQSGQSKAQVKGLIEKNRQVDDVRAAVLEDQALNLLLERAEITEVASGHFAALEAAAAAEAATAAAEVAADDAEGENEGE